MIKFPLNDLINIISFQDGVSPAVMYQKLSLHAAALRALERNV